MSEMNFVTQRATTQICTKRERERERREREREERERERERERDEERERVCVGIEGKENELGDKEGEKTEKRAK